MLRLALRRAATGAFTQFSKPKPTSLSLLTIPIVRVHGSHDPDPPKPVRVALEMIQYALGHARSQKTEDSYTEALLVMEQGISNLRKGSEPSDDAVGMLLLASSTLLYERGELYDAMDKLHMIYQLERASLDVKVAGWEGLIGLNLEAGQDVTSSVLADDCLQLLRNAQEGDAVELDVLNLRAKAIKGLTDLVHGEIEPAESFFSDCQNCNLKEHTGRIGNVALSLGEFLHSTGNFLLAKGYYEKAQQVSEKKDISENSYLATANIVSEEVLLGATCALGQLLSHMGNFHDAEEFLTKALTKAEEHFGTTHPKLGVILTCIAIMFGHKAKQEGSSSILIQEGLYRRAIELLKAPPLDIEITDMQVDRRDIVALARGGYGELLCLQKSRKGQGERMMKWAETAWRNGRLSLAQVLEFPEPSKAAVVDTRIGRVL